MLDKLAARLPRFSRAEEDDEDDSFVMNLDLNLDKHPPAEMPPTPPDLDTLNVRAVLGNVQSLINVFTSSSDV